MQVHEEKRWGILSQRARGIVWIDLDKPARTKRSADAFMAHWFPGSWNRLVRVTILVPTKEKK